jgi:hypothetical protein
MVRGMTYTKLEAEVEDKKWIKIPDNPSPHGD